MRFSLITFLIAALPVIGLSQKLGKFYYNKYWELTTKDSASYVRMCVFDTVANYFAGPVTDMYLSGKPQMKGYYKARKKDGEFTFYYENGTVESVGMFENDRRIGKWTYYYSNGNKKVEVEFTKMGASRLEAFYDTTGERKVTNGNGEWYEEYEEYKVPVKIIVIGSLRNYNKHGEWTCRLSDGTLVYTETYREGHFLKGFTYPGGKKQKNNTPHSNHLLVPFKLVVTEVFGAAPNIDFTHYPFLNVMRRNGQLLYNEKHNPADTQEEIFTIIEESAFPPEGMAEVYKVLAQDLRYPQNARRMGVEGAVYVEFIIDKDGSLLNFSVSRGLGGGCDEEALRVFKKYSETHKWKPAMQLGKPVRQRMVMPLMFKLG